MKAILIEQDFVKSILIEQDISIVLVYVIIFSIFTCIRV